MKAATAVDLFEDMNRETVRHCIGSFTDAQSKARPLNVDLLPGRESEYMLSNKRTLGSGGVHSPKATSRIFTCRGLRMIYLTAIHAAAHFIH